MANTIKIKNSGTANSAPTSLEHGELAINYADGKIFYKNGSNAVITSKLLSNIVGTANEISVAESSGTFTISLPDSISLTTVNTSSDINVSGKLSVLYSSGQEGGEIFLAQPQSNNTLSGGVTIDVYQNKIRFFEQGGSARGAYIDLTAAAGGASTNLLSGGASVAIDDITDVTITSVTSGDFLKYNGSVWINDAINLGTDTSGSYVESLIAGNNIILSNNSGESATPTITVNSALTSIDYITAPDYIQFDNTYVATSTAAGKMQWDSDYGTLQFGLAGGNVNLRVGQEQFVRCYNAEATTLTKGTVVYIYGAQGDQVAVKRANNSSDTTSSKTLGIVAESISSAGTGYVVTQGLIPGLDTSAYSAGDILWLSSTDGQYTKTKPVAPEHLVFVGVVVKVNASAGQVFVKPQNGYELDEIHDVKFTGLASGDFLKYNGSLWVNDAINLGTDTVGDYVQYLNAGSGMIISNNSGEGSTPMITVDFENTNTSNSTTKAATANAVRELQIKFLMEVV